MTYMLGCPERQNAILTLKSKPLNITVKEYAEEYDRLDLTFDRYTSESGPAGNDETSSTPRLAGIDYWRERRQVLSTRKDGK